MIPTAKLRVEIQPIIPPKPIGFVVVADDASVLAVLTYEEVKKALEKYETLQAAR